MQLRELREFADRRGWQIVGEYVDTASGAKDIRPALARLMSDIYQRRIDCVLVWKLDRFGRSLRHLLNALAELEACGVAFVSLRDNLDLGTPSGRFMFQIIGAMAEFERSLIQERVKAGLRNARTKGKRLGRPRVDARKIATLRAQGCSWREPGPMGVAWTKSRFSAGWKIFRPHSEPRDFLFPLWRLWFMPRSLLDENISRRFNGMINDRPDFLSWWHESCGGEGERLFLLDFRDGAWNLPWELLVARLEEQRREYVSIARASSDSIPESPSISDESLRVLIVRGGD